MGKPYKKARKRLDQRQADFDRLRSQQGRKRPGSLNMHKQVSAEQKKGRIK